MKIDDILSQESFLRRGKNMGKRRVTIDGVEYWQPECHCEGGAHTCYLRPVPQETNLTVEQIMEVTGFGSVDGFHANDKPVEN